MNLGVQISCYMEITYLQMINNQTIISLRHTVALETTKTLKIEGTIISQLKTGKIRQGYKMYVG